MRKYLVMMLCAGLLFTATGCGDEKKEEKSDSNTDTKQTETTKDTEKEKGQVLNCSYGDDEDFMIVTASISYDKDGKTMESMNYTVEITVDDDMLESITEEDMKSICDEFDDSAVKSCKGNLDGKKYIANIEYDINKLEDESDEYEFSKNTPIDELKDLLASGGYMTCKIEK